MLNLYEVLIALAITMVGGAIIIVWIWAKRSSVSSNDVSGDRDISSKPRASSIPPAGQDCEVFLSFRGKDTRKEFTDHLYNRLNDAGIWVFRDNERLLVGEKIGPELIKAIKTSKISIPIISPNYASSEWCLRELVQILECKKTGQIVMPIFYKVAPTDVRNQTGEFRKGFLFLQNKRYSSDDIQEWRNALKEVASLKGLESNKIADGHEGELVKMVLRKVFKKLKKVNLVAADHLVGVQGHIEKITEIVDAKASDEVRGILIHGMGGIGKTTLAKLIYNKFSTRYDHCSFLPNVRERSSNGRGKLDLQKQLISDILEQTSAESITCIDAGINIIKERFRRKKVLILLDDVDDRDQLDALAKEDNWFGPGSIVIVTSRNADILVKWGGIRLTYELNELDREQSFQLFSLHAFGRDDTRQSELELIAKEIVSRTGGLPLAIEVIGCLLFAKPKDGWEDTLKILKETPNDKVMGKLRISYDSLNHAEQQIFLDIACFSFGVKRDFAYYMWDACRFHPRERVKNLVSLSLIKIGNEGQLIMHDQLKDLGKAIVHQNGYNDFRKCSRLWSQEEAWEVLNEKQGTEQIEALCLVRDEMFKEYCLTGENFKDLTKLRLLFLEGAKLDGDFHNVFTNLKWLQWSGQAPEFMPTNFHPKRLVVLDLENIPITEHWSGWSQIEVVKKLKVVRLKDCRELTTTPDFSALEELEILIIEDCPNLIEIHPSIGSCKNLIALDVSGCGKLEKLPTEVGELEKMKKLIVDRTSIKEIHISKGSMTELEILSATECRELEKLPNSIGSLVSLHTLSLNFCTSLTKIPESIGKLTALSKLNLGGSKIVELPESIGDLHNLIELSIDLDPTESLVPAIGKLRKLRKLVANNIREVPEIGELLCLQHLSLSGCGISSLPASIHNLTSLQTLELLGCTELASLPDLPCSVNSLGFHGSLMETLPSFSHLTNLKSLGYYDSFQRGNKVLNIGNLIKLENLVIEGLYGEKEGEISPLLLELPSSLVHLTFHNCPAMLADLDLSNTKHVTHLELTECPELRNIHGLEGLKNLNFIYIGRSPNLVEIRWLDKMESLEIFLICQCSSLEKISDLSHLKKLKLLGLDECEMLSGVEGINQLSSLDELRLSSLSNLKRISDLSHLKKLERLLLFNLKMLSNVENIGHLASLDELHIEKCPSLKRIGDLSHLKKLTFLWLSSCKMLSSVEGIGQLTSLINLHLHGLPCLKMIGDLSHLKKLKGLYLEECEILTGVEGISRLTSLERLHIKVCSSLDRIGDLSQLKKLKMLILSNCKMLTDVEGIGKLASLDELRIEMCPSLERISDLSHLKKLTSLRLSNCKMLSSVEGIGQISSLIYLHLNMLPCLGIIGDLSHLKKLKALYLEECEVLSGVEGIARLTSLERLHIKVCSSLERIGVLSHLKRLKELVLSDSKMLSCVEGIGQLSSLDDLRLSGLRYLKTVGDLSHLKKLKRLYLFNFEMLTGVKGIGQLASLDEIHIERCPSLERINDLSPMKKLTKFRLFNCKMLSVVEGIGQLISLERLHIKECPFLRRIGDLSHLKKLKVLKLEECEMLSGIEGIGRLTSLKILKIVGCNPMFDFPDTSKLTNLVDLTDSDLELEED